MLISNSPIEFAEEVTQLYHTGLPRGDSTGWPSVDKHFTVATGFWTVVTGIPSHGKSTWVDNLMLNLIEQGWKAVVYSPENQPTGLYISYLLQKYHRRPFRSGFHGRMDAALIAQGIAHLDENIRILTMGKDPVFPTLTDFMAVAEEAILEQEWESHKTLVVLDPWNQLDHTPIVGMNETQMIAHELMTWRQWCRNHLVHGVIVAHPQKPQRTKDGEIKIPGLYDINGSAAWYNQCDQGIVIERRDGDRTLVHVEKVRFQHIGSKGEASLQYNNGIGTFQDVQAPYEYFEENSNF